MPQQRIFQRKRCRCWGSESSGGQPSRPMRAAKVHPITDLEIHTKEIIDQAVHSGEPVLITQNGRARVVVIDAKWYEDAQATLAMLKLLAQSQDSAAPGDRTYSSEKVRRRAHSVIEHTGKRA